MTRTLLPAWSLAQREVVRFLRQRNRVVGALLQPALFWALFGAGFHRGFQVGGGEGDYLKYMFPGTVALVVLFTAIFSTFSIIEDRNAGFLQSVLAAPVTRSGIVLGKIGGGVAIAVFQGLLFLALAPIAGISLSVGSVLAAAGVLVLMAASLTALGIAIAWPMESVQGFHAVMMLFLMPMWLLSGAFFPFTGAAGWLVVVMRANPLSYGVALLHHALGTGEAERAGLPDPVTALAVSAGFAGLMFVIAQFIVGRPGRKD
ncbi:MAG: ABC transporter permease [Planctomycetes bacterium]|nr:ABC transporter permease [Planctomycetota bacterium]